MLAFIMNVLYFALGGGVVIASLLMPQCGKGEESVGPLTQELMLSINSST